MQETYSNSRKVMVVDDSEIDRFMAEKILTKEGFAEEVVAVESAMDALEYLTQNQTDPNALPGLIFLDINMPEMSGFDFLEEYARLCETVKKRCIIVMLSSSILPEDHDLAMSSPYVCDFIGKPLNPAKLKTVKVGWLRQVKAC